MALTAQQVQQFYIGYYGRPADPVGLAYWQTQDEATALKGFSESAEFTNQFTGLSASQQVTKVYGNLLGRTPDTAGLLYWAGELTAGRETIGSLVLSMLKNALGKDVTTIEDRVTYSTAFTTALNTAEEINAYAGTAATQAARDALLKVVATAVGDHTALNAETAKIDATIATIVSGGGSNPGQTFTLTTGVDNIVGTAGNDTITGVVDTAANGGTLTPGDVIDGGAGTDTANFVITTAAKWSAGATVKNVENIVFRDVTAAGDAINATNIAGATSFTTSSSTAGQTLTINNIQANAKLGIANSTSAAGVGNSLTVDFKDGTFTAGGTVSADFNVAGAKTAAGIERSVLTVGHSATAGTATDLTLALTATGANYVTFTDGVWSIGGLKTITAGGTGSLDIIQSAATEFANVTTVNASANSGGLTIDLTGNNKDVTFTGGSGNDTLTLANFNATDSIDGGAGNDTLNVSLANVLAFTKAAPVKNVETLGITLGAQLVANQTVNGDFFGISNVTINDGPDLNTKVLSLSNLANGANVTFKASSANTAGTISVDVKGAVAGTNESATLTFGKAVNFTTNAVTINAAGLETITLATSGVSGGGAKVKAIADAQLTTLKFTGSDGITVTDALAAGAIKTVDASGVVKDAAGNVGGVTVSLANSTTAVTFTGGQGADTYTASAKGDTINGSLGIDTVTLGGGADKLVYTAANQSNAAGTDVINGFTVTADSIQFAASLQSGTASYIGAAAFTNTGATQLRMNGANLEVDLNGDTTADMVITLTGISAADFGAANFSFA